METFLQAPAMMPELNSALWIMSIFGAAWSTLFWFSTDILAQFLAEKDINRLFKKSPQKALTSAKAYAGGKNYRGVLGAWGALLLPTLPILAAFIPLKASPFFFGGFVVATGALTLINGRRWMRNFRIGASRRIARFFLANGNRDEIDEILEYIYLQEVPRIQLISIEAMGKWGSDKMIKLLEAARFSNDPAIAQFATQTHQAVTRRLGEARPLSVKPLENFFREYEHWNDEAEENAALPEERAKFLAKRNGFKRNIEEIIQSQMHLRNASPDLYCMECHTFSEEVVYRHWRFVRCKSCKDASYLQRGIKQAIGRIGEIPAENPNQDGVYYLDMWDQEKTSATPGEVEKIEILNNANFNYDWAVSAVVEAMENRFPDDKLNVPIEIDPEIDLSNNTRSILSNITTRISAPQH